MIAFALKLLLAHLLGDFALQQDAWVKDKRAQKHLSPYLYLHVLIHGILLLLLLQEQRYWPAILIIVFSHLIIDFIKLHLDQALSSAWLFMLDQLAHLAVLICVVYYYYPFQIGELGFLEPPSLLLAIALLMVTYVSAVLIKLAMNQWNLQQDTENDSLSKAGRYIGILERLFVFGFIVLQQWPAIGLLIAAKSVFRFGDLSRAKDRKLTEYVLIGTLLSFGLAILTGVGYQYALEWLVENGNK